MQGKNGDGSSGGGRVFRWNYCAYFALRPLIRHPPSLSSFTHARFPADINLELDYSRPQLMQLIIPKHISLKARLHGLEIPPLRMSVFKGDIAPGGPAAFEMAGAVPVPPLNAGEISALAAHGINHQFRLRRRTGPVPQNVRAPQVGRNLDATVH